MITITSFTDSLLYQESDIAATVFADEATYPVEAVSARVAHICRVDSLAMPLGLSTLVIPSGYGKDTSVAAGMAIVSHLL